MYDTYEVYGRLGADEEDPYKTLKLAAWSIGIAGFGFIVFTALIASEVYGARERREQRHTLEGIKFDGKKYTPNQLAKKAVIDKGSDWNYFLEGEEEEDVATMTQRELDAFHAAGDRQFDRVVKLLDPKGDIW